MPKGGPTRGCDACAQSGVHRDVAVPIELDAGGLEPRQAHFADVRECAEAWAARSRLFRAEPSVQSRKS